MMLFLQFFLSGMQLFACAKGAQAKISFISRHQLCTDPEDSRKRFSCGVQLRLGDEEFKPTEGALIRAEAQLQRERIPRETRLQEFLEAELVPELGRNQTDRQKKISDLLNEKMMTAKSFDDFVEVYKGLLDIKLKAVPRNLFNVEDEQRLDQLFLQEFDDPLLKALAAPIELLPQLPQDSCEAIEKAYASIHPAKKSADGLTGFRCEGGKAKFGPPTFGTAWSAATSSFLAELEEEKSLENFFYVVEYDKCCKAHAGVAISAPVSPTICQDWRLKLPQAQKQPAAAPVGISGRR